MEKMERSGMKFRTSGLLLTFLSVIAVFSPQGYAQDDDHSGHATGGELKHGRYIGYILFDDTNEKLAVVSDFYVESPEDLRRSTPGSELYNGKTSESQDGSTPAKRPSTIDTTRKKVKK